jgi:hypothetical protein
MKYRIYDKMFKRYDVTGLAIRRDGKIIIPETGTIIDHAVFEEFSGSLDENKEKLYEGDIVFDDLSDNIYGIICKGKHKRDIDGYGTFVEFDGFYAKFGDFISSLQLSSEWRKIGNIHENSNIIETK